MHLTALSDSMPNFEFDCTFCYAITPLMVTTTHPPLVARSRHQRLVTIKYDVNFNQAIYLASVTTSDLMLSGNAGGNVTSVASLSMGK